VLNERNKLLDPQTKAANLYIREGNLRNLDDILGDLRGVPELRLVVLDPARAFADGSEDQSERASAFFDKLLALARDKDCAVVVVHHLGKNARPKSLDDVVRNVRGSGVYVDRPRAVLGMYRTSRDKAKRITRIGVAKWNLLDKDKAYEGARPFAQDEVALRHLPADEVALEGADRTPSGQLGPDAEGEAVTAIEGLDASILNAIDRLNGAGHDLTRTGPKSLHSRRQLVPGLADIKRREIESAVDRLIAEGAIHVQDGGLQAVRS
jgi:hypothetical protein